MKFKYMEWLEFLIVIIAGFWVGGFVVSWLQPIFPTVFVGTLGTVATYAVDGSIVFLGWAYILHRK